MDNITVSECFNLSDLCQQGIFFTSEGRMSLFKKFPHQSRLFCSKRYDSIQSPIDLNLTIKFDLSLHFLLRIDDLCF
jgi:hypothetical protein